MRSLHINKFWYRRGGADIYAIDLATAIIARGEDVHVLSTRHPSNPAHADDWAWPRYYELAGGGQRLRWSELLHALPRVFYNWDASRAVRLLMDRHHFQLAHVHNFTRHLSPAALLALRQRGVPIVATIHDHWPVCPAYVLLHGDGTRCERECVEHGPLRCVQHRCIGSSRWASIVGAAEFAVHRQLQWQLGLIDAIICPSRYLAHVLSAVTDEKRIRLIPHPRPRYSWTPLVVGSRPRVLFAGRLGREKGVEHLIAASAGAAWDLEIAGDGPYQGTLRRLAGGLDNVRFLGSLPSQDLLAAMRRAHVVAIPSVCYENAPLTLLEAMAVGRPIVASNIGGIPEHVAGVEGARLVEPDSSDAIRSVLESLTRDLRMLDRLGRTCWEASQAAPGWEEHLNAVLSVYRSIGG